MTKSHPPLKITTIGAGSVVWGPTINADFLSNPALDGAELVLMDINAETLDLVQQFLQRLADERGFNKTISATTNLEEALRDADYVLTAISVGGDRLWRYDAIFPQIYDIFQPVGDTIGPGGMMRALRHIPPLLHIGRKMQQISKPGAALLQLTNPMNPLCDVLSQQEGMTVYGICHGYDDTETIIAKQLGVPKAQVHVSLAGNNHHVYCYSLQVGDRIYTSETIAQLTPQLFDTPFREEVFRRYGLYVGNSSRHPIEFLPNFLNVASQFGRAWGVSPIAEQIDPLLGVRHNQSRMILEQAIHQVSPIRWREERLAEGVMLDAEGQAEIGHSREIIDAFIVALEGKQDFTMHLNVPNQGGIVGVDPTYNVEMPVTFRDGKMLRPQVHFPAEVVREIERVGREQHLLAQACLTKNRDLLIESLTLDALVPNRAIATNLVQEMMAFEQDVIDL